MKKYKFYIGKKDCGCAVFACSDRPEWKDETAKTIADAIKSGLTIEHIESDTGPELTHCKCGKLF